jgi:hypothetical protein
VNPALLRPSRLRKRAARLRAARSLNTTTHNDTRRKPAFHRHFCTARKFFRAPTLRKNLAARNFPKIAPRSRCGGGVRRLHTKLSGVTVIFFLL